jgi:hypothetical protein
VARPGRLELPTLCLEGRCSIQLSYGRIANSDCKTFTGRANTDWDVLSLCAKGRRSVLVSYEQCAHKSRTPRKTCARNSFWSLEQFFGAFGTIRSSGSGGGVIRQSRNFVVGQRPASGLVARDDSVTRDSGLTTSGSQHVSPLCRCRQNRPSRSKRIVLYLTAPGNRRAAGSRIRNILWHFCHLPGSSNARQQRPFRWIGNRAE